MAKIVEIIKDKIISQYQESTLLIAFFEALADQGEELSLAVENVNKFRTLQLAQNKNLDVLGSLVGQGREVVDTEIQVFFGFDPDPLALSFTDLNNTSLGGRYRSADEPEITTRLLSDSEYRSVLSAAIQRNISKCTPDEIISALIFVLGLVGSVPEIKLVDGNTYYSLYIGRILNTEEKAFLSSLNLLPKTAGVNANYIEYEFNNYFGFLSDPTAKGFGSLSDQLIIKVNDIVNQGVFEAKTYKLLVIADLPVGYWTFSEIINSQISINEMGGPDASNFPVNSAVLGQIPLKVNDLSTSIMHIGQGRSEISLGPSSPLNSLIELTIEIIFSIDSNQTATRRTLISHQFSSNVLDNNYWIYIENDNKIGITMANQSSSLSVPLTQDSAHYLVLTRSITGYVTLYLNNVLLVDIGLLPIVNSLGNIFVGNDFGTRTTPSLSLISDVSIYNYVLSALQRFDHYRGFVGDLLRRDIDYESINISVLQVNPMDIGQITENIVVLQSIISTYSNDVITSNAVAYYRLNESSGLIAFDMLGGPDGVHTSQVVVGAQALKNNDTSLSADYKSNTWLQRTGITPIPSDPINISGDLTIEFIFRFDPPEPFQDRTILSRVNLAGGFNLDYWIYVSSDQSVVVALPDTGDSYSTPNNLVRGTIYYFAVTITSTIMELFIDGKSVRSGLLSSPRVPATDPIYFGNDDNLLPLFGLLSDVAYYAKILSRVEIAQHASKALGITIVTYQDVIIQDAPIAYWRLGELSGTTANDLISVNDGNHINGPSLNQNGLLNTDSGRSILYSQFDKSHTNIPVNSIFSFTDGLQDLPFSIDTWIKPTSLINENSIISKTGVPGQIQNEWSFLINIDGSISLYLYPGITGINYRWQTAPGLINAGVKYFVASTYSGLINSGKIYIDGLSVPVTFISSGGTYTRMQQTTSAVRIGMVFFNDASFEDAFDGFIQEMAIYNYELSPTEILNHYNAGTII